MKGLVFRWPLIERASACTHNQAFMTVYLVLPGKSADSDQKRETEDTTRDCLGSRRVQSLVRTTTAEVSFEGAERIVEDGGIRPLTHYTILLGHTTDPPHHDSLSNMIAHLHNARRSVAVP